MIIYVTDMKYQRFITPRSFLKPFSFKNDCHGNKKFKKLCILIFLHLFSSLIDHLHGTYKTVEQTHLLFPTRLLLQVSRVKEQSLILINVFCNYERESY